MLTIVDFYYADKDIASTEAMQIAWRYKNVGAVSVEVGSHAEAAPYSKSTSGGVAGLYYISLRCIRYATDTAPVPCGVTSHR